MICDDCLDHVLTRVYHKGRQICQRCYGKQFPICKTVQPHKPTLKDLKKHFEKKW